MIATLTLNPAVDLSCSTPLVSPEHKLRCAQPRRDPGGGGVNVARAVRKLGGEALAVYTSGGLTGRLLDELLAGEGVPHVPVPVAALTRENFTVLEADTGREFRFVLPGPPLSPAEREAALRVLAGLSPPPSYLVASGSLPPGAPPDLYARAAASARRWGARFVLDTSGEALREALGEGVYLVKPNLRELEGLTGRELPDLEAQAEAARELVRSGAAEVVALTLGAEGALLVHREGARRVRPPPVETRSSVGAGDSFVAGLVLGLTRGLPLEEAFCFGVAAGTAALLTPGTELCRREDAEELFARICAGGE